MSSALSVLAAKLPDAPVSLANVAGITTGSQVGLSWSDGAYNGGSPVIDYRVSYAESSSSTWIVFASGIAEKSEIVTGLTSGVTYKFKVQSRNVVDFSLDSSEVSILAAQQPDAPTGLVNKPAVTSASQIGLQWVAPTFNGGSALTNYQLWYDNASGSTF
jgi:hypothetical protein